MRAAEQIIVVGGSGALGGSSSPQIVGGAVVGEPGTGFYSGYTLSWGDDFETLDIVGPQAPSGKFFPTIAYGHGPRGNLTSFASSYDADPLSTGYNDSNRGVPVGFDNMSIVEPSVVRIMARKATVGEQAHMMPTDAGFNGGVRNEVAAILHTAGAVGFFPTENAVFVEVRCRISDPPASMPGGTHPTPLWTYTLAPTAGDTGDEIDYEGTVSGLAFRYNVHVNGVITDAGFASGAALSHYDNTFRTITFKLQNGADTELYVNNVFHSRHIGLDSNSQNLPSLIIMTNHILVGGGGADTYSKAAWDASPGVYIDYDWIRVWRTPGVPHWRPLASVSELSVAYNASGSVVLPSKTALWGDASVVEYVQVVPYDIAEPGVTSTGVFEQFPSYITYNAGTRTLTADFTAGTGKAGRSHVVVYGYKEDGSTMEPLRFSINRGPNIATGNQSLTVGTPYSYDVYADCDVGIMTPKVISVTGLGSGLSFSTSTGLITGTPSGAANLSVTINCTNNAGQLASKNIAIDIAALNVIIAETDHVEDNSAKTTYFVGEVVDIGPADTSRLVVFSVHARNVTGPAVTSLTVNGGTPATKIRESTYLNSNYNITSMWQVAVPTGTTLTIDGVTFNTAMFRCAIEVQTVLNSNKALPTGGAVAHTTAHSVSQVASITVPANGGAIIASNIISTATPGVTPTNYTTDRPVTNVGSTMWYTGGHDTSGNTGARTYTALWTGVTGGNNATMVAAAWGP